MKYAPLQIKLMDNYVFINYNNDQEKLSAFRRLFRQRSKGVLTKCVHTSRNYHALCTLIRVRSLYRDDTLQTVFP